MRAHATGPNRRRPRLGPGIAAVFAGLAIGAVPALGEPSRAGQDEAGPGYVEAAGELFLADTLVTLRDGRLVGGRLMGVDGDILVLNVADAPQRIPRSGLAEVEIRRKRDRTPAMVTGGILSAYLCGVDFFKREAGMSLKSPLFFELRLSRLNLRTMGPGIFLGWLAGVIGEAGTETFIFSGGSGTPDGAWERLRALVAERPSAPPRFHLTVQAGQLTNRAIPAYKKRRGESDDAWYQGYQEPGFNLLRGLRISYSITPSWDIGYARAFLAEPYFAGHQYSPSRHELFEAVQDSSGHYLTLGYRPRFLRRGSRFSGEVGIGLGAVRAEFRAWGGRGDPETGEYAESTVSLANTVPGLLAFAEWRALLYAHLSVGLAADFAWMPTQAIPALDALGLPARRISLSNGSVGFALGFHY